MKATIRLRVKLKTESEGGRIGPFNEGYCPHFVVEGTTGWLGVRLVKCPELVYPGEEREADFELMYLPQLDYAALQLGRKVAIHEGPKIIGTGIVIESDE